MREKRITYYEDELGDEFSTAQITPRTIGDDYVYIHTSAWKKLTHFFWYRIVATPCAWLYMKIAFHHRIENRKLLSKFGKNGYFIYGNHTQPTGDAFAPSLMTYPKDAYAIVHPNNVSMPLLGKVTPSMGAMPLPDTMRAGLNFISAVETRYAEGNAIVIYPEAHIWPYYTKIRPFTDKSFQYPVKLGAPVFCFTNTYKKRKLGKKPRIVTYIDGPFYADDTLTPAQRRKDLRDRVYAKMCERSRENEVEMIEYRRKGEEK